MKEIMKKFLVGKMEKDINEALDTFTPAADIYCTIMTPVGDFNFSNPAGWEKIQVGETVILIFTDKDESRYKILRPLKPMDSLQYTHCLAGLLQDNPYIAIFEVLQNTGEEVFVKPYIKAAGEEISILKYQKGRTEVFHLH